MKTVGKIDLTGTVLHRIARNALVNFCVAFGLGVTVSRAGPGDGWFRDLIPAGHLPGPGVSFAIVSFVGSSTRVSANAFFNHVQGRDGVTLHGKQSEDGFFEPNVAFEVATEGKDKWKALRPQSDLESKDTITVSPERARIILRINLRPLEPWIGIYRYARLTLENGDFAVIALEDLLPTASARDPLGNFKEDVFGLPKPSLDKPGVLSAVISLGDRLIGEFILGAKHQALKLEGTRTADGDFWPTGTFEASRNGKKWSLVSKSVNAGIREILEIKPGTAEKLRFILTAYKTRSREDKFGRITLSNGDSMEFYLERLDPHGPLK